MKNYIKIICTAVLAIFLASCLDDTGYLDVYNGVNKDVAVVSIGQAEHGLNVKTIDIQPEPTTISVVVNAARLKTSSQVTLAIDPAILDRYNEEQAELDEDWVDIEMLPADVFQIPSLTVTIPANTLDVPFTFTVNSGDIDLSKSYALPLVITDAENAVVASNLNTSIVNILVKNAYDGKYNIKIGQSGWTAYTVYEGPPLDYDGTYSFLTAGMSTVSTHNDPRNSALFPGFSLAADGSPAVTHFGNLSPEFTFAVDGTLTSIANPAVDARNRQLVLNPAATAGQNKFDLTDRSFEFNLLFKQDGRPDMNVILQGEYAGSR